MELQDLAARENSSHLYVVRDEAQIYPGHSADVEKTEGMSTPTEDRGDLLIRKLWKHQTDGILDVRITNLDTPSSIHRKPESDLLSHERERRRNTFKSASTNTVISSLFVVSCM